MKLPLYSTRVILLNILCRHLGVYRILNGISLSFEGGGFIFFQCCFKNVLMEFLVVFKKLQWSIKDVLMVFAGCFKFSNL